MQVFDSIRNKLVVAFLVVVLLPLLGTGLYGNWVTSRVLEQRAIDAAQNDIRLRAEQVVGFLDSVRGDVLYLVHLDSLRRLIEARAEGKLAEIEQWRKQVARDFLVFSSVRPMYYQIRYIAENGHEIVRIDSDGRTSRIIPDGALQDKAHRYYFTDTMALNRGQIFVSPLDLNIEHGRIEVPYQPVIRYATPVFDHGGQRRGIVIVNVYAERFLFFLYENVSPPAVLAMADQDGYYLAHPDPERRWGGPANLDTGHGIEQDYPDGWPAILSGTGGIFHGANRVMVYISVYPDLSRTDYYWVVLYDVPRQTLFATIARFRTTAVSILSAATLVALMMAVVLARQLTAPIQALRRGVERFGQGELDAPLPVTVHDEVGELTAAFNEMAAALCRHLEQLTLLHRAGQQIAAGLERAPTLEAIVEAAQTLFPVEYCVVSLAGQDVRDVDDLLNERTITVGDDCWAPHRETAEVRATLQAAMDEGQWQARTLSQGVGPDGVLCCAPLCIGPERRGLIELYGRELTLAEPATGSLLQTLAVQACTALENVSLYEALSNHRQQLEALVEKLIAAHEDERKVVAYDIHDGLLPYLVGARLQLSNGLALLETDLDEAGRLLDTCTESLVTAIREGRRIIEGLRPVLLDDLGLVAALDQLARSIGEAEGWRVRFEVHPPDLRVQRTVEITAFRIAQEALTNARKYARTERVSVRLVYEDSQLVLSVADQGRGFDVRETSQTRECVGLVGMQERARLVGGRCTIESAPGQGTTVRAVLPLAAEDVREPGVPLGKGDSPTASLAVYP